MDPLPPLLFVYIDPDDTSEDSPVDPIGLSHDDADVFGRVAERKEEDSGGACPWCAAIPPESHAATCRWGVR